MQGREGIKQEGGGAVIDSYTVSDLMCIMHRISTFTKWHHPYPCIDIMYDDGLYMKPKHIA